MTPFCFWPNLTSMRSLSRFAISLLAVAAGFAQGPGGNSQGGGPGTTHNTPAVSLKIPNETVPPGGVAQMKFLNTEPTPISSGRPHGLFDPTMFDDIWGIQLFNSLGDLNGVALVDGSSFSIQYISNGTLQGTDYPVMTIALHVRPNAVPGSRSQFDLDPSSSFNVSSVPAIVKPIAPATVTVGGSISIVNVVPGGGLQPAGAVIRLQGLGFQPRTQVQLSNVQAKSISVVSSTEIDIVLAQATDMTGKKIQVVNPDGSQDTYFSYLRGVNMGVSNWGLLNSCVPIFSSVTHSHAVFPAIAPAGPSQFSGIAVQNPTSLPVNVTVSLRNTSNSVIGQSTIPLPSGYRFMREIHELLGITAAPGNTVVVTADQPIQVFAYMADTAAHTVAPIAAQ
jgi:hypothetical protein